MKKIIVLMVFLSLPVTNAYADYIIKAKDASAYSFSNGKPGAPEAKGSYTYIVNEENNTITESKTAMDYDGTKIDLANHNPATWNIIKQEDGTIIATDSNDLLQDFIVFYKDGTYRFFQNWYYLDNKGTSIWFGNWERVEINER